MNKKTGRPRKEIDWDLLDKLCFLHCTMQEIAGALEVSLDHLEESVKEKTGRTLSEYWQEKAAGGRIALRRKQLQTALEGGNVTMMIWLGKQLLKQTDKQEVKHEVTGDFWQRIEDQYGDTTSDDKVGGTD
ncbi:MAG: hypothetical protein ACOY58_07750 [Candidatus Micrarchaeota archaeon]